MRKSDTCIECNDRVLSARSSSLHGDVAGAIVLALALASTSFAVQGCAPDEPLSEPRGSTTSHVEAPGGAGAGAGANARGTLVPMYMQFSDDGDWLMSRTAGEGAPKYHYNGIAFFAIEVNGNTRPSVPLYRCLDKFGTHYQSTQFACESEGSKQEGLLAYVYANDPGDGAKQIWRCIAPAGKPIISTVNLEDCNAGGFIKQFPIGWAYPGNIQPPANNGAAAAPAAGNDLIPMQMQWSDDGDWMMSRVAGEGAPAFHYNGFEFSVFDAAPKDSPVGVEPLYRCLDKFGTHYQSNLFACESEGSKEESLLGYVYKEDPNNGAKQIWRCIAPAGKPIVATLSPDEVCTAVGWTIQLSLGWAFPAGVTPP